MARRIDETCILILFFSSIYGHNFKLKTELIESIYQESDSATVMFIGSEGGFLSDFMRSHNNIPVAIFDGNPDAMIHHEENSIYRAILVVQYTGKSQNLLAILLRFIQNLCIRKHVIIFTSNLEHLAECFSFFWGRNFTRIFGIVRSSSYVYLPFADYPVQKISQKDTKLVDALKDLNGFPMRTIFGKDFPRIFRYTDEQGSVQIGGIHGLMFLNFLRKHNGTFMEIERYRNKTVSIVNLMDAIQSGEVDLLMNLYHPIIGAEHASFPVDMRKHNIMVPINGVVGPNEYFLRPFSPTMWLCIGSIFVYIILMDVLKDICIRSKADLWESFSRIFLMMLRLPTEGKITTAYRFHIQVLLLAFVLGNIYTIYFTSFLTVFIKIRQHETIQDLIDSNVKVLIVNFELEFMTGLNLFPSGFEKIAVPVDFNTLAKERDSMRNTSFAYSVGSDKGNFLINFQAFMTKPLFRLLPESVLQVFVCFLMPEYSPLKEIIDRFSLQIVETGLYDKWQRDAVFQAYQVKYFGDNMQQNVEDINRSVPLTLRHFEFAWNVLLIGLIIAVLVFLGELLLRNSFAQI